MSKDSNKTLQDRGTLKPLIPEVTILVNTQTFVKHRAGTSMDESKAMVNTIIVYVAHQEGKNRECFTWTRFGQLKLGDMGSRP